MSSVTLFLSLNCYKRVFFLKGCKDKLHLVVEWYSFTWTLMHRIASVEEYKNQFDLSSPLNVFHYLVLKLRIESRTN